MFEPLSGLGAGDVRDLLAARELALPDDIAASLIALTSGNAQLLLLAIDALRHTKHPTQLVGRLLESDEIERYLLREVDARLNGEERLVMRRSPLCLATQPRAARSARC